MSLTRTSIPTIAITTDDGGPERISSGFSKSFADVLTDVEDLDSDGGRSVSPAKVPLLFAGVGGDGIVLTDSEYIEGSDDDDDYRPKTPTPLDNLLDFEGTFEELLQVTSDHKTRGSRKSKGSTTQSSGGFLGLTDDPRDGLTDYEDFALSDDDWIEEDLEMDDIDLEDHMPDGETVDIADRLMRSGNCPSPSVTPEPGAVSQLHDTQLPANTAARQASKPKHSTTNKRSVSKKKVKSQFLLPRQDAEPLCDVTDTEILQSDSDEEQPEKRSVRRRKRATLRVLGANEDGVTDVEDLEIPANEVFKFTGVKKIHSLHKAGRSVVHISENPIEAYVGPEEDTDSEDMNLSDREEASPLPLRKVQFVPKSSTSGLMVPTAEAEALTDVEDLEANEDQSEDEEERPPSPIPRPLQEMETHYGSVTVSYQTKERNVKIVELDNGVSDQEDFTAEESDDPLMAQKRRRAVMKYLRKKNRRASTDEDDMEASDGEFKRGDRGDNMVVPQDVFEVRFMEVEGEARPVIVAPRGKIPGKSSSTLEVLAAEGGLTDVEEMNSAGSSEEEEDDGPNKKLLDVVLTRSDSLTDVEDFDDNDNNNEDSSDMSDGEVERALPEVLRELTLIHHQAGGPVVITLPLSDDFSLGLLGSGCEASNYLTDVEDVSGDEQDTLTIEELREYGPTPELPEMDFGIIDASEAIKVHKKKLKPPGVSYAPLTDTEDVYLVGEPNRRKKRTKNRLLQPKAAEHEGVTDVEELDVSDAEAMAREGIAVVRRQTGSLNLPQGNTDSATDVEDMDASDDDPETPKRERTMSVTPDVMKHMDYSTTTFTEGSGGSLGVETRQRGSGVSIPTIITLSPSPDNHRADHTDSEEMQASADEDINTYSRADTATPMDFGLEMEEHASSFVHVKHTRKLDYEAAEEAIHMKSPYNLRETHTDVEELGSEDESRLLERLSVEDTAGRVCVCLAGNNSLDSRSVCICVGKPLGDVSMEWNNVNATSQRPTNSSRGQEWTGKPQDSDAPRSGAEGLMSQGAAGGSSITTTETRIVEGSDDTTMQELLDKLAAEQRK